MSELPLSLLLIALTFLVLLICCFIVGWSMYQLGLHGRVFKMMKDAEKPVATKEEKEETTPVDTPYNPFTSYEPRFEGWTHPSLTEDEDREVDDEEEDLYLDEEDLEDKVEFAPDPVTPNRSKRVVMTNGNEV